MFDQDEGFSAPFTPREAEKQAQAQMQIHWLRTGSRESRYVVKPIKPMGSFDLAAALDLMFGQIYADWAAGGYPV